jgi:tetratricopeptide (TPR) repeat protein
MGCDPIIFIGHDLSWTNKTHADTLDESGEVTVDNGLLFWEVTDPRSRLKKIKKMCIGQAIHVPGYYGSTVVTNIGLSSFITSFEEMIKNLDRTVINATEGGVNLKGTERMSLNNVLNKYCKSKIDKSVVKSFNSLSPNSDSLIDESIKRLKSDIELCNIIISDGKKAFDAVIEMEKLAKQKRYSESKMKELMTINEEHSTKSEHAAKDCPLVGVSILAASRKLHSNELYVEKTKVHHMLSDREGLKTRIKRNKIILEAARKTAKDVKKWCGTSLDILEQYKHTRDESLLTEESGYAPNLADAEKFFKVGNWATPLIEARNYVNISHPLSEYILEAHIITTKAENMREDTIMKWKKEPDLSDHIQYQALMDKARDLGMKEQKFKESLALLEKAKKLMPKEFPARWGLANALTILKKTKQAVKEYESLIKDFPDNIDIQFEYGCALLDIDVNKGITQMIDVMQKTNKYDHMFIHIGNLYMKAGEYEKARDAYKQYLEKYPQDPNAKESLDKCNDLIKSK